MVPILYFFTRSDLDGGEELVTAGPWVRGRARPMILDDGVVLDRLDVQHQDGL